MNSNQLDENNIIWDDQSEDTPLRPSRIEWEEQEPMPWSEVAKQAWANKGTSLIKVFKDTMNMVYDPNEKGWDQFKGDDTAMALINLGLGAVQKLIPEEQESEKYADALWQGLKEEYGGVENIKRTIANNPWQIMMDIGSIAMGGSGLAMKATKAGSTVNKVMRGVNTVARYTDPISMAGAVMENPITKAVGKQMYKRAMKVLPSMDYDEKQKILKYGVDYDIPIGHGGRKGNRLRVNDLMDEVEKRVRKYAGDGMVDREKALDAVRAQEHKYRDRHLDDPSMLDPFQKQIDNVRANVPEKIPVKKAHANKQGIYAELDDYFQKLSKGGGAENKPMLWNEAKRAYAKGLMMELEEIIPELASPNLEVHQRLKVQHALDRAVNRIDNHNFLRGMSVLASGFGYAHGGISGALKAFLAETILNNPAISSKIALALYHARKKSRHGAGMRNALAQTGRVNEKINNEKINNEEMDKVVY